MNVYVLSKYLLILIVGVSLASCMNNQDEVSSSQETSVIKFYYEKGRYHDLLSEANALSGEVRNDPELRFIVANTYLKIGHAEQAFEMLEALKAESHAFSEIDLLIVETLLMQGKVKEARDLLLSEEIQKEYLEHPKLALMHAQLELAENNTKLAKSYLLKLGLEDKGYEQAQVWLAKIELLEGRQLSAVKRIEKMLSEGKESAEAWLLLANIKFSEQEYVDAENYYLKALKFDNSKILTQQSLQIAQNIVRTKTALGNVSSGKSFYQTFLESYPKSSIYYLELAKLAYANNEMHLAEQHLTEVLKLTQNNPRIVSLLAKILIKQNKLSDASTLLQSYAMGADANLEWIVLKVITDMGLGNYEVAIDLLNRRIVDSEQSRLVLTPLLAYMQLENQGEENYIKTLSDYDVNNTNIIRSIGGTAKIFAEVGKNDEAENFVGQLVRVYPDSDELKILYLSFMGSAAEQQDKINQWLSEQPKNVILKLISINYAIEKGGYSSAVKQFKDISVKKFSERENKLLSNTIKSLVFKIQGHEEYNNVFDLLVRWQKVLPDNMQLNLILADIYITESAYAKAVPLYETILSQNPNDYVVLNNLAWSYFSLGDDRALETAERAYASNSNDGPVCDTLGWILVKSGQADKGLQYIQEALEILPGNKEIQSHYSTAQELVKSSHN